VWRRDRVDTETGKSVSAIIMEYRYEHAVKGVMDEDVPEYDFVVITVFDVVVKRIPVHCHKYWTIGERDVCEQAVVTWLQGNLDGG
jgi:hypothetical protein